MSTTIKPHEPGAAEMLIAEQEEALGTIRSPRARARAIAADRLVAEAQALLDAPLLCDPKEMSAEVSRAKNRAEFRMQRAKAMAREWYGDKLDVDAKVQSMAVVAFVDATSRAAVETIVDVPGKPPQQPSAYEMDRKKAD